MRDFPAARARCWLWAFILLALSLQCATLFVERYPPLLDLPNHMARHVLEADWLRGRALPPYYRIEYHVVPNLGADLVMPLLLLVLEPLAACKLFLALAVLVNWLGPALYIVQVNGGKAPALVAALLLLPLSFSSQFFWGFLSYYSGFGPAFLLLVHWLRLSSREPTRFWENAAHALLVALLFLWHLAAWGIYGVLAASHLFVDLWRRHQAGARPLSLARRGLSFVLVCSASLVLLAVYALEKSSGGLGDTSWGPVLHKLTKPMTLFLGYDPVSDAFVVVLWFLAIFLLFKADKPARSLAPQVLALALLGVLYLVIPRELGGTGEADSRLLPAMRVCALAMLGSLSLRHLRSGLMPLTACLLLRQGSILRAWREQSRRLESHVQALDYLPRNSRVLPLVLALELSKDRPELHFIGWAVVSRRVFLPTLFAFRDQQPLRLVPTGPLPARSARDDRMPDETALRASYDFVWIDNPYKLPVTLPASMEKIFAGGDVEVWRVR